MARLEKGQEDIVKKLDEHVKDQKEDFQRVFDKLDTAVSCKADKTDLDQIRQNQWLFVVGILMTLAGTLLALIKTGVIK